MENSTTKIYFEEVYKQTERKIKLYLLTRCNDMHDVNDLFQEIYMDFYKVLLQKGTAYVNNPEAFVMKITKRKLHKFYGFLHKISNQISMENEDIEEAALIKDNGFDIEEQMIHQEIMSDISHNLIKKPGDVQKIFYLHYSMDYTLAEVAAALGLKESTVKTNMLHQTLNAIIS